MALNFTRITVKPTQMGGVPCIRGRRIPVATVAGMVADGMTVKEILHAYPDLQAADVSEALRFAAETVCCTTVPSPKKVHPGTFVRKSGGLEL
ncbi:MAG: DUF433 domain-containing protein [Verrucomicrobiota bacterium]